MLNSFKYLVLLWITVAYDAAYAEADLDAVHLTISNSSIPGSTHVINCSVDQAKTCMETVVELILKTSDTSGANGVFYQVASVNIWSDNPLLTLLDSEDTIVNVSGKICNVTGQSCLTVAWNSAYDLTGRSFSCWVNGITQNGNPLALSRTITQAGDVHQSGDSDTSALLEIINNQIQTLANSVANAQTTLFWYIGIVSQYSLSTIFRGKIYLATMVTTTFDLTNANIACGTAGGYLLEIDDGDEHNFVNQFTKQLGGDVFYATGTNDIDVEGFYVHYHSGLVPAVLNWTSGEPNDATMARDQDCVALHGIDDGLNDIPCDFETTRYVCEVPFPPNA